MTLTLIILLSVSIVLLALNLTHMVKEFNDSRKYVEDIRFCNKVEYSVEDRFTPALKRVSRSFSIHGKALDSANLCSPTIDNTTKPTK